MAGNRDDEKCDLCDAPATQHCPRCNRAVCDEHTLAAHLHGASRGKREAGERIAMRLGGTGACDSCLDDELLRSRGPLETVHRSNDPVQAQMLVDVLRKHGFDAMVLGTRNAALIGVGQIVFSLRIQVPQAQAQGAGELIEAWTDGRAEISTDEGFDDPA